MRKWGAKNLVKEEGNECKRKVALKIFRDSKIFSIVLLRSGPALSTSISNILLCWPPGPTFRETQN